MAQWVKVLASKLDDQSSISEIYMSDSSKCSFDLCVHVRMHTQTK